MTMAETVGWVLVHFVWQGTAIALVLAALLALTSAAQATLRYALSCAALVLMVAAILATAAKLTLDAAPSPALAARLVAASAMQPPMPPAADERATSEPRPAGSESNTVSLSPTGWRERLAARILPAVERSVAWLVAIWIAGVVVMSIRLAGGWWRTHVLRVAGVSAAPADAHEALAKLCGRLGISRDVGLVASARVSVPIVLGHLKPVIVIPAAAFAGLSPAHLEAILAHELAHVRRHDYLVNLVQSVMETLLFYHPAVWWVSHQVRVAREHCCDDLAVRVCGGPREYIHALLDLEELRGPQGVLALGATDGSLLGRARRLLRHAEPRSDAPRLAAAAIVLSVAGVVGVPSFVSVDRADASLLPSGGAALGPAGEVPAQTATPQQGEATPVTSAPDPGGTLASRWAWAERAARDARRNQYWIGYGISPVEGLPRFVYFDRDARVMGSGNITLSGRMFSDDAGGLLFAGRRLAVAGGDGELKVLFRIDARGGTPNVAAVHVSTLALPVDLDGHRLFWLGPAATAQSLELIDKLYARAGKTELKDDLVSAAGVHDASPAVVAWLAARVDSGDPDDLRGNAAEWIAHHPIRESIGHLDRIARGDRASSVRQEAAEAMGDLALPEAASALVALARTLPDEDEDARREAVEALGERTEPVAHEALAAIAREDASADIQREAVETLGDYEDGRGVPLLTELARTHPDVEVRREAVETLGDAMPADKLVPLLKELAAAGTDAAVQEEAIETLADVDDPRAAESLRELARTHPDDLMRIEAVKRLGETAASAESVALLKSLALSDRAEDVQREAIEALAELPDGAGIDTLVQIAREHPNADLRKDALEALFESDHPKAREVVNRALGGAPRR